MKRKKTMLVLLTAGLCLAATVVHGQEVDKGGIPEAQLEKTFKTLPWGAKIWDVDEAVAAMKNSESKVLWVDTRPKTFFDKGTVRNAKLLIYGKQGEAENTLTKEALLKAIQDAGFSLTDVKIAFFCQGPKCHRSYNATIVAINTWGFSASQIIWFRDGYPNLFKAIREDPKLKRAAKRLVSDSALKEL